MDGITILNKAMVEDFSSINFIVWFLMLIACYGFYKLCDNKGKDTLCVISFFTGIFIVIAGVILSTKLFMHPTGHTDYQVTITKDVGMTEFYDKYEVISHDGDLWTIRNK